MPPPVVPLSCNDSAPSGTSSSPRGIIRRPIPLPRMNSLHRLFVLSCLVLAPALARADSLPASAADARPLGVGAHAPAVTLTDVDGTRVELGKVFAAKPTVLV